MNFQKITDDVIRQRLGSQPQYGMACGGKVKHGYADAGPIVLNDDTISAMNSGMSTRNAVGFTNKGYTGSMGNNFQPSGLSTPVAPMSSAMGISTPSQPSYMKPDPFGTTPNARLGLPPAPALGTWTKDEATGGTMMKDASGNMQFRGKDAEPNYGLADGGWSKKIARFGDKIDSLMGTGTAQATTTPIPAPPQPKQQISAQAQAIKDVRTARQRELDALKGMAKGGVTIGLIEGKVDPTVADDTTISLPSGIDINAKKGEFVLSIEDVDNMGGPEAVEHMVKMLRKRNGQSCEMGPKEHDEPDNYGRMDKEGLAKGGWTPPYETDYSELVKASPISNVVGFGIPAAVQKGSGFVGNVVSAMGSDTDPMAMVKGRTQDVADQLGSATRNIATPLAAATQIATRTPVTGIQQVKPQPPKPYALPANYEEMQAQFIADQQAIPVATRTPLGLPTATTIPSFDRRTVGPATTPEQDEASRQAAQEKLNAGYADSATQQDKDRAAYQQQLGLEARAVKDRDTQSRINTLMDVIRQGGNQRNAGQAVAAAQQELALIQGEQNRGLEQQKIENTLQGQRLANEGLPEQRRAGIVNDMKRLGLTEKELGMKEKQFGEEMGLKREQAVTDAELKKMQLSGLKQQSDLSKIPYDAIMGAKTPADQLSMYNKLFGTKKEALTAKDKLTAMLKIAETDPEMMQYLKEQMSKQG